MKPRRLKVKASRRQGATCADDLARSITDYLLGKPGAHIPTLFIGPERTPKP